MHSLPAGSFTINMESPLLLTLFEMKYVKACISFEIFSVIHLDFYGIFLDYFLPVPSLDHFQYLIQIISSIFFGHISVYNLSRLPTKASFSTELKRENVQNKNTVFKKVPQKWQLQINI